MREHATAKQGLLGFVWPILVVAAGLLTSPAPAQETEPELPPPPIEEQPYLVDVRICFDRSSLATPRLRADVLEQVQSLLWSCLSEQWQSSVREVPAPPEATAGDWLRSATAGQYSDEFEHFDKLMLVAVSYDVDRWVVELSEVDLLFLQKGPIFRGEVREAAQLPREIVTQVHRAFTPHAAIESREGRQVTIRIRASKLPLFASEYRLVQVGSVFRPFRTRVDPATGEPTAEPVNWCYVVVTELRRTRAVCRLVTAVAGALPPPASDPSEIQLLGVKSNGSASRLCVVSRDSELPVVALEVEIRRLNEESRIPIGTTGYDGCIRIPPSDGLVLVYLRQGRRPLAILPVLPGSGPLPPARVTTFEERLEIEGRIAALQDRVIDYVVRRTILIATLRRYIKEGKTGQEAARVVEELKLLPPKEEFQKQLEQIRQLAQQVVGEGNRIPASMRQMIDETNKLIERYIDPNIIADAIAEYEAAAGTAAGA